MKGKKDPFEKRFPDKKQGSGKGKPGQSAQPPMKKGAASTKKGK